MGVEIPKDSYDQLSRKLKQIFNKVAKDHPTRFKSGREAYEAWLRDQQAFKQTTSRSSIVGGFPTGAEQASNYIRNNPSRR